LRAVNGAWSSFAFSRATSESIDLMQFRCGLRVLGFQDLSHPGGHLLRDPAHLLDGRPQLSGKGGAGVPHPGDLGDVAGQVSHSLEVGGDAQGGNERAQVGGDRLLTGQDGHHAGFEVIAGRIDHRVLADHLFGNPQVTAEHRGRRAAHRVDHQHGQLHQLALHGVEFLVLMVPHESPLPGRQPCPEDGCGRPRPARR
jgi:hypothetical protein